MNEPIQTGAPGSPRGPRGGARGGTQSERSERAVPPRPCQPPLPESLPPDWQVAATPELHLSPREGAVLVVEPESASWLVLEGGEWEIMARLLGRRGEAPGGEAPGGGTQPPPPVRLDRLQAQGALEPARFAAFILRLFRNNMVSINGKLYYEPSRMWEVQSYPHYVNIHMTEACNLACRYCRISSPETARLMEPATARLIARRTVRELPAERVLLSFHGGEPLLNLEAIRAASLEAAETASACGKQVDLAVQSNGTLLEDGVLEELRDLGVSLGVSLDGPAPIHDRCRVDRQGRGTHASVSRGLERARALGRPAGLLAVVHEPGEYVQVLEHLVKDWGCLSPRINFSALEGRAATALDFPVDRGEAFGRAWMGLLDAALAHARETGLWLGIADLNLFLFHLISKVRPHMCYRSPCGAGSAMLAFSAEGDLYPCDELVGVPAFRMGSIHDGENIKDLLDASPVRAGLMEARRVENVPRCARCPWRRFHGSGCANKSFRYFGTMEKEDPMCRFYSFIFPELMWRAHVDPSIFWLTSNYADAHLGHEGLKEIVEKFRIPES